MLEREREKYIKKVITLSLLLAMSPFAVVNATNVTQNSNLENTVNNVVGELAGEDNDILTYEDEYGTWEYIIKTDGTAEITNFSELLGVTEIIVPSEINGISVTSIGEYAVTSGERIIVPGSIKNVKSMAFARQPNSELKSVVFEEGVISIGESVCYACSGLEEIIVPKSVTSIGEESFYKVNGVYIGTVYCVPGSYAEQYCIDNKVPYESLGIEIKANPTKTTYFVGEEIDLTGGTIVFNAKDALPEEIPMTSEDVTISGYDNAQTGKQMVTVEYQGYTTEFETNWQEVYIIKKGTAESQTLGDINRDGFITSADSNIVMKYYTNALTADEEYLFFGIEEDDDEETKKAKINAKCDINGDGTTDFVDAKFAREVMAGQNETINKLKVGEQVSFYAKTETELVSPTWTVKEVTRQDNGNGEYTVEEVEGETTLATINEETGEFTAKRSGYVKIQANYGGKVISELVIKIEIKSYEDEYGIWEYAIREDDTIEITGYTEITGVTEIIIPSTIDGKNVTEIGKNAFVDCDNICIYCMPNSYVKEYCTENNINYKTIGISVIQEPNKVTYIKGETVDLTGGIIEFNNTDATTKEIPMTAEGVSISEYDKTGNGTKTITVTYEGYEATFDVTYENVYITAEGTVENSVVGDADKDGFITPKDAMIILDYNAGVLTEEEEYKYFGIEESDTEETKKEKVNARCDIIEDEEIDILDATYVLQIYAGITDITNKVKVGNKATFNAETETQNVGVTWTVKEVTRQDNGNGGYTVEEVEGETTLATIDEKTGEFTAKKAGYVKVQANYEGIVVSELVIKITDETNEITGISVKTNPTKIIYIVGEEINLAGGVILATYEDGTTKEISMTAEGVSISEYDKTENGRKTITVKYEGYKATFEVTHKEVYITAEETVENPVVGDIDKDGFITINDGEIILKYEIGLLTAEEEYKYFGVEESDTEETRKEKANLKCDINADGFSNGIDAMFAFQIYAGMRETTNKVKVGDKASFNAQTDTKEVGATWTVKEVTRKDNGNGEYTVEEVEGETTLATIDEKTGEFTAKKAGYVKVEANYEGIVVSELVIEITKEIEKISVKTNPTKTIYKQGEQIDLSGGQILVTYNDKTTSEIDMTSDKVNVTGYDANKVGKQIVKVSYEGYETTFEIMIANYIDEYGIWSYIETSNDTVEIIGYRAIEGVTDVVIPGTIDGKVVTSIAGYVFDQCYDLTSVTIPGGVTSIGNNAFYNCINLTTVTIPENVTSLGNGVFGLCSNLTTVILQEGLTTLGKSIFMCCDNLKTLVIPKSVTWIGEEAFYGIGDAEFAELLDDVCIYCYKDSYAEEYCSTYGVPYKTIGIEIIRTPSKTTYVKGEAIDLSGGKILFNSADATTTEISMTSSKVSVIGYDANTPGTQTVTITYEGYEATFEVTVTNPETNEITGISIKTKPTKTTYIKGEDIDLSGGIILATYEDGTTKEISMTTEGISISEYDKTRVGQKAITVIYEGHEATFNVTHEEVYIRVEGTVSNPVKGDVNKDGFITIKDAMIILDFAIGGLSSEEKYEYFGIEEGDTEEQIKEKANLRCDMDEDGVIMTDDAMRTYYISMGVLENINKIKVGNKAIFKAETETQNVGATMTVKEITRQDNGNGSYTVEDVEGETTLATIDEITGEFTAKSSGYVKVQANYNGIIVSELVIEITNEKYEDKYGIWEYIIKEDGTIEIVGYTEKEGITGIIIPSTIDEKEVTSIKDDVFSGLENICIYCEPDTYEEYCEKNNVPYKTIGIEITQKPSKLTYIKGEELDLNGGIIEYNSPEATTEQILMTSSEVSKTGYDANQIGEQTITIGYAGYETTFTVEVISDIIGISIDTNPSKTKYIKGEELDLSGGMITVKQKDGVNIVIPMQSEEVSITGYDANKIGQQTVTVTYEGHEATFTVEVTNNVTGIKIKTEPTKTTYIKGEEIDLGNGKITVTYEDGTTEEIAMTSSEITITGYDANQIGEQTVTITYQDYTTTFTINVIEEILKTDEYEINVSDGKNYIENIKEGTTVEEFKNNISTEGTIEIYKDGEKITDEKALITTGMEVHITLNDKTVIYETVIIGDISGDGKVNQIDLLMLARYKVGFEEERRQVVGARYRATDVDRNKEYATDIDMLKLARALVHLDEI